MSAVTTQKHPETFEWIIWFSELPARVSWQMVKDALRLRVGRGVRNVRHGGPRFISADVGTPENGKLLYGASIQQLRCLRANDAPDQIGSTGIEGLQETSFRIAWGYVVRGKQVYPVKFEEQRYLPPKQRRLPHHPRGSNRPAPTKQCLDAPYALASLVAAGAPPIHPDLIPFSRTLTINGLPFGMTSAAMEQILSTYGAVVTCQVNSSSQCIAEFRYTGDAQCAATHLHGQWLEGCCVQVSFQPVPPPQEFFFSEIGDWKEFHPRSWHAQERTMMSPSEKSFSDDSGYGSLVLTRESSIIQDERASTPLTDAGGRAIVDGGMYGRRACQRTVSRRRNSTSSDSESDGSN